MKYLIRLMYATTIAVLLCAGAAALVTAIFTLFGVIQPHYALLLFTEPMIFYGIYRINEAWKIEDNKRCKEKITWQ